MTVTSDAVEVLARLVDHASFETWDESVDHARALAPVDAEYARRLARAAARSGTDEAVRTGRATVGGRPVALVVGEFRFLGGSLGVATAHRLRQAVQRATRERLPLLALPASGGTRMQEGAPAFVEMIALTRAVEAHKRAGLPYVVYLRNPTMGGVLASWASRGHLTFAEPGALLGFLGPTVYAALRERELPAGVQVAENLAARGHVDAVVPLDDLRETLGRTLGLLAARPGPRAEPAATATAGRPHGPCGGAVGDSAGTDGGSADRDAWECVRRTQRSDRPGVRDLLAHAARDVVWLHGADAHGPDPLVVALADVLGEVCLVVGQDRVAAGHGAQLGPAALRLARRSFETARSLGLPVLTVIDTPGAELSPEAEDGGLAREIAACIAGLSSLTVPTVAVLLGQGTGGGALALLGARRVVAAEDAWLAPLPLEGASVILHGTTDRAPELARTQGIRARDLADVGFVHVVVAVPPTPEAAPVEFSRAVAAAAVEALRAQAAPRDERSSRAS